MQTYHSNHFLNLTAALFICLALAVGFLYGGVWRNQADIQKVKADSTQNASGFAWSDNVGWISFNCLDSSGSSSMNTCGTSNYGVNVDSSGNFSGYAWSDNIGWISFNTGEVVGCPAGTCTPHLDLGTRGVSGWARACGVFVSGCSGALRGSAELGDWDGWIRLSGASSPPGGDVTSCIHTDQSSGNQIGSIDCGVYYDSSDFKLKGFAWGSDVVGWVDFGPSTAGVLVSFGPLLLGPPVLTFDATTPVAYGGNTTLTWSNNPAAASCMAIDGAAGWDTGGAWTKPGQSVGELSGPLISTSPIRYSLKCKNASGESDTLQRLVVIQAPFTVTVDPPLYNNQDLNNQPSDGYHFDVTVREVSGIYTGNVTISVESVTMPSGATFRFPEAAGASQQTVPITPGLSVTVPLKIKLPPSTPLAPPTKTATIKAQAVEGFESTASASIRIIKTFRAQSRVEEI